MTTNKPEAVAWYTPPTKNTLPVVAINDSSPLGEPLVRLSDYEALQAELAELKQTPLFTAGYRFGRDANDAGHTVRLQKEKDALQAECESLRAKTGMSLGVGDGTGNLFVHGDYDSIKHVQALIFECEKLRKDAVQGEPVAEAITVMKALAAILRKAHGRIDAETGECIDIGAECMAIRREFDRRIKSVRSVNGLVEALELISDTDPDEGTAWFHDIAHKALANYHKQGDV